MPGLHLTTSSMPDMSEKKSPPQKEKPVIVRTPQLEGKAIKRKSFTPGSPPEDDDKKITPKRKRSLGLEAVSPDPGASSLRGGSCSVSRLNVPLSERQQMALLMRMTDESVQGDSSPKPSSPPPSVTSTKRTPADKKVNKRNDRGETPLHIAAKRGDVKQTKKLIKAGASINVKDYAGWTPMHEACNQGNIEVAKQLLKAGANVNVQGFEDDTPLHDAASNGHAKLVSILLKHGANPLQTNLKGKTPVDVAHDSHIEKLLRREIISSNSDASSADYIRSPTSPESLASIKDEDRMMEVEEIKPRSASMSVIKGDSSSCMPASIGNSRRMSLPPKSPVDKTSSSPRLFLKFKSAGSSSGEEGGPNHGISKSKDSKDPLFKSYILTMDTGDQLQQQQQSYYSYQHRERLAGIPGDSPPSPASSPVSSFDSDMFESRPDVHTGSHHHRHHHHHHHHHHHQPSQKLDLWDSIIAGPKNNVAAGHSVATATSASAASSLRLECVLPDSSEEESSHHPSHISGLQRIRTEPFTPKILEEVSDDEPDDDKKEVFEVRRAPTVQIGPSIPCLAPALGMGGGMTRTFDNQHIPSMDGVNHSTITANVTTAASSAKFRAGHLTAVVSTATSHLDLPQVCMARTGTVTSTTGTSGGVTMGSKDAHNQNTSDRTLHHSGYHSNGGSYRKGTGGSNVVASGNGSSAGVGSVGVFGTALGGSSGVVSNNGMSQNDSTGNVPSSSSSLSHTLRWEMRPRDRGDRVLPRVLLGTGTGGLTEDVSSVKSEKSDGSISSPLCMDIDENTSASPRSDKDPESRPSSPKVPPLKIILPSQKTGTSPHAPDHLKNLLNKPALPYVLNPTQDAAEEWKSENRELEDTDSRSKSLPASLGDQGAINVSSLSSPARPSRPSSRAGSTAGSSDRDENKREWNAAAKFAELSSLVTKESTGSGKEDEESKDGKNEKDDSKSEDKRPTRTLRSHTALKQQQEQKQLKQSSGRTDHSQPSSHEKSSKGDSRDGPDGHEEEEAGEDGAPEEIHVHPRKRKLRARTEAQTHSAENRDVVLEKPPNPYKLYFNLRRQLQARLCQSMNTVTPKPPQGYKDYLMVNCTYVLEGNATSRLSVPLLPPPCSVTGPMKELFIEQEKARYRLRLQHHIEREKLMLAKEQEILREHARAARAIANQSQPLSVCTILREEEIYNLPELEQVEEREKNSRSRYNGRQFLSWIQDVGDKYETIKNLLLLRHHHEAESLHAVQKMDWEWKLKECGKCDYKSTPVIDEVHLPMVQVNDDFELLPT
ncbi:LOW QUALITY PROTEIN: ankyrin repeat domain-containing protein 11-like [Pomacea canaliculata]|uniref:LOW QUALITY PROTEIN: ankyrin repeat domain-containing protein 11-like n=1 Tax=Pomacea canaliculata TaxID=400727 RepID=UPI000D73BBF8|nr:LOW QUALITY PROTEIN: ankyrin repeat domain-containing protein 11-like [Pomacea canaliculata]